MKVHLLALLCLTPGMWTAVHAQTANKVGVLQTQAAIANTKEGQKAFAELEARLEQTKSQLEKQQADIRELQDKLQKGGNVLPEAARNELIHNIDQKTKSYTRDVQDAQDEAELEQRRLFDELLQKMMVVIDKYAVANGYSLILDASNQATPVIFAVEAVNITKQIVELYDKEQPALPLREPVRPSPVKPGPSAKKQPGQ